MALRKDDGLKATLKKLAEWFSENGRAPKVIVALGLAGIVLIMGSELLGSDGNTEKAGNMPASSVAELEIQLEERLKSLLADIEGAGEVRVMITLESGIQLLELDDRSAELVPEVRGVTVVCDGAGSPVVTERITEAVTTALGVPSTRVCVLKMGQ